MNTEELRQAVNKYCEETHQGNFDAGLDIGVSQWTLRKFRLGGDVTPRTLQKIEKFFSVERLTTEEKYKKALEEIRAIVSEPCILDENCATCNSNCMNKDILNKINEVL